MRCQASAAAVVGDDLADGLTFGTTGSSVTVAPGQSSTVTVTAVGTKGAADGNKWATLRLRSGRCRGRARDALRARGRGRRRARPAPAAAAEGVGLRQEKGTADSAVALLSPRVRHGERGGFPGFSSGRKSSRAMSSSSPCPAASCKEARSASNAELNPPSGLRSGPPGVTSDRSRTRTLATSILQMGTFKSSPMPEDFGRRKGGAVAGGKHNGRLTRRGH